MVVVVYSNYFFMKDPDKACNINNWSLFFIFCSIMIKILLQIDVILAKIIIISNKETKKRIKINKLNKEGFLLKFFLGKKSEIILKLKQNEIGTLEVA